MQDRILDVREIPSKDKHSKIFELFTSLKPGENFILINDHDPKPLYYQFEAERKNEFTWEYLEQGPLVWRVKIGKAANLITPNTRVSDLIKAFPETINILSDFNPHFTKLKNKALRATLARRVTLEQAASIAGVSLEEMLNTLSTKLLGEQSKNKKNMEIKMKENSKPAILLNIDENDIVELDVRPILENGTDPFLDIMEKVKELKPGQVLKIINSFEPIPLYTVMKGKGYQHYTVKNNDTFEVYFYNSEEDIQDSTEESEKKNITELDKMIEIDVREMEPPKPMIKILNTLEKVDDKTVLVVHHHREPVMLYPKLEERGYTATCNKIEDNYYKVIITKNQGSI